MSLLYLANFAQVELYYLESGTVLSRQASCSVHCLTATANEPLRMNKAFDVTTCKMDGLFKKSLSWLEMRYPKHAKPSLISLTAHASAIAQQAGGLHLFNTYRC